MSLQNVLSLGFYYTGVQYMLIAMKINYILQVDNKGFFCTKIGLKITVNHRFRYTISPAASTDAGNKR
ncbi:hypothetical protein C9I90_18540 [Photobacterium aphoticum]|uniref:Uncharacterized protein n=1 Tax=Photobacterium aphoticum TaxID=754436 RepID=A0A0J1GHB3_9GAMM|nr:hypothetical protein ABT58_18955 [Photobacterium aphoticum]PSU54886.1 hypothetical protein C9I90_18540 [Photobacterium aphoticum]